MNTNITLGILCYRGYTQYLVMEGGGDRHNSPIPVHTRRKCSSNCTYTCSCVCLCTDLFKIRCRYTIKSVKEAAMIFLLKGGNLLKRVQCKKIYEIIGWEKVLLE